MTIQIWNLGILLALNTGLRIGELSALKHEDIKQDFIRIQRTEVKVRNKNGNIPLLFRISLNPVQGIEMS